MAIICDNKGHTCSECARRKYDADRSAKYGQPMYSCNAKPDKDGFVEFKERGNLNAKF